jgi:hypothetical protein
MTDRLFLVTVVTKKHKVKTAFGVQDLELNWADGMMGAMPVFEDLGSALKYVDNDDKLIRQIERS